MYSSQNNSPNKLANLGFTKFNWEKDKNKPN